MKTHIAILTLICCFSLSNLSAATYSGGDGSAENPYQIADANDLLNLAATTADYNKCFILTADIDLEEQIFTTAVIAPDTDNITSNYQGTAFTGTFDGNGHKITNFTINGGSNDYLGLFGYIDSNGTIQNLGVENCTINGTSGSYYVGGLAGYSYSYYSFISNCYVTGSISGSSSVGGLVGYKKYGNIICSYSSAAVNGSLLVGGLVGDNNCSIIRCYATGAVSSTSSSQFIGGLLGKNGSGVISRCYSTGTVTSSSGSRYIGGLVGLCDSYSTIDNCYSTSCVNSSSSEYIGGLVGSSNANNINQCYARGSVTGTSYVGGLVGATGGYSITQCYSTGAVNGTSYVYGLIGYISGTTCSSNFWDTQTSGRATSPGGIGKTTALMQTLSTFTSAGWDFSPAWIDGDGRNWVLSEGIDYPTLISQTAVLYHGGSGTAEDPYQIANRDDILSLTDDSWDWDKHFVLTSDIDMAGTTFPAAIISPDTDDTNPGFQGAAFIGIFDGNGHKITNFIINGGSRDCLGLFGQIGSGGQIKNLGLENCTISGSSNSHHIGGLVGWNYGGNISQCYSTITVNGYQCVGGLVGNNSISIGDSIIIQSYATGSVSGISGSQCIGGLVGSNSDIISQCYSTGAVNGSSSVGGLVGYNNEGSVFSSFWNTQTSGRTTSEGGKGRTTAQMKQAANYIGWNTPAQTVWTINEGNDYPRLAWQNLPGTALPAQTLGDFIPGQGTAADPYHISTANQINIIGLFPDQWNNVFHMENDIDFSSISGTEFNKIGYFNQPFTGTFNGLGHVIHNFSYTGSAREYYIGLFGYTGPDCQIKNLGLKNCTVSGYGKVGGLAGYIFNSIISRCYATGSFTGNYEVGGLAGYAFGSINQCYTTGIVSGTSYVGGLIGRNDRTIYSCYSSGFVNGSTYVGGLVGYDSSSLIASCFWDTQTSGQSNGVGSGSSAGVIGKTTAEMKTLSTFTDAEWDFLGETDNGTDDAWRMCVNGVDYPKLTWEYIQNGDFACPDSVAIDDLLQLSQDWLMTHSTELYGADASGDMTVNLSDFEILAQHWLEGI